MARGGNFDDMTDITGQRRFTIVTGPTGTGKTSSIQQWIATTDGVCGIVQPVTATGRQLMDIGSRETSALEPVHPNEVAVEVGRFRFRAATFEWANQRLHCAAQNGDAAFVVIDEVGPLELRGAGMDDGVRAIIANSKAHIVLMVRDSLIDAVVERYGLYDATVVEAAAWPQESQSVISARYKSDR